MGRAPCCDKTIVKRGPWSSEEDITLKNYVQRFGTGGNWIALPHKAGLKRCGKSCRLRWLNYLRPNIRHGGFTDEEDNIILTLYNNIGSRWSVIASHLQGRTDNDVKNYWNTKLKKKLLLAARNTTNAIHFSSTTPSSSSVVTNADTNYHYGNSDFSNYQQNLVPQGLVSEPAVHQASLPRLMEVPEIIGPSAADGCTFRAISSSEEVSSFSPFENKYGLWSGNGGGGGGGDDDDDGLWSGLSYDLRNGFGFDQEKNQ